MRALRPEQFADVVLGLEPGAQVLVVTDSVLLVRELGHELAAELGDAVLNRNAGARLACLTLTNGCRIDVVSGERAVRGRTADLVGINGSFTDRGARSIMQAAASSGGETVRLLDPARSATA